MPLKRHDLVALDDRTPIACGTFLVCCCEWREPAERQRLLEAVRRALMLPPMEGCQRELFTVAGWHGLPPD